MDISADHFIHNHFAFDGRGRADAPAPRAVALGTRLSLEEAYSLQHELVESLEREKTLPVQGFKISMTNVADRGAVQATEPAYGHLTSAHLAEGNDLIHLTNANHPLVEPELAIRTTVAVNAAMTQDEIAAVTEVAAGLEIPICRLIGWWPIGGVPQLTLSDFIADNAGAGRVVHGSTWLAAASLDLTAIEVELKDAQGEIHHGTSARVLDNPLNAVKWLAEALARSGREIPVGAVISSGTFMPPLRAVPGRYTASFSAGLGSVHVDFV